MNKENKSASNLELGRGKRPKLNNQTVSMRMSASTKQALEYIADLYEITYGNKPWIAGLLEKLGTGELMVVPAPPAIPNETLEASQRVDPKEAVKDRLRNRYCPPTLENIERSSNNGDADVTSDPSLQSRPVLSSVAD